MRGLAIGAEVPAGSPAPELALRDRVALHLLGDAYLAYQRWRQDESDDESDEFDAEFVVDRAYEVADEFLRRIR